MFWSAESLCSLQMPLQLSHLSTRGCTVPARLLFLWSHLSSSLLQSVLMLILSCCTSCKMIYCKRKLCVLMMNVYLPEP
uniref:Uncharacterized protein n=1 Tax=Anguilla anguilla TaxID=7936 RepID=A0A0E9PSZ6_ANGAN